jgi:hypothetical protein
MTPADRTNFAAMRVIVALNALWLVLSRPDLPELSLWPSQFFNHIPRAASIRFFAFRIPAGIEWMLYVILAGLLIAVAFGVQTRFTALAAALLLYRFAALEPLVGTISGLWFTCFTHLVLGLLFIAAAGGKNRRPYDDRWPVAAFQALFALYYFFCGLSKITTGGLRWATPANFRAAILAQQTREIFWTPWADRIASNSGLCLILGITTLALELLFPLVLISRRARIVIVPATLLGHIGIALSMGLLFLNWPLLLIYVDWGASPARASSALSSTSSS